ncbi:site-specific integrase, partial [Tsukamurella ocularis]
LLFAGPRPGEAGPIDCADLAPQRGRIRIHKTKSRRARDVPVGGQLLAELVREAEGRPGDAPLLLAPRGGRWTKSAWESLWDRIGVDGVTLYELRHTAASMAIAAGADVKTIQAMLGHQSAAMTLDTYGHLWHGNLDMVPGAVQAHMQRERERLAADTAK